MTQTYEFQTEARELLDLMVHSIYSNKDIFLRELISNASDALDKRRFAALTNPELLDSGVELEIHLKPDKEPRTLEIRDNGIGMGRDEVVDIIGTIAKSGTKEFLSKLKQTKDANIPPELIGQFGVGFYSSFMVSDRVVLVTRKAGEEGATRWESDGGGTFTVEDAERDEPGTTITLHLKDVDEEDGLHDYTEEWAIRGIVKRFSDFVAYPIKMPVERREVERDEEGKPKEGTEKVTTEIETLNSMKAIWTRPEKDVEDEEYNEFYKHISHDWNEPLTRVLFKIEGTLEYRGLIFIPSQAPFDLFHREGHRGVHLYVKRVFIMDDCKELVPEYLRFLRGVVDSEDLSLNISREMIQKDRQIQRMRKGLVKKILSSLKELRDSDEEKYRGFWTELGRVLKEGVYTDLDNRAAVLELILCESTHDKEKLTTLADYVSRMKEGQEKIYYMTGSSREEIEGSPHLEALLEKGYEVLILTDPVDELWTEQAGEFEDKQFQSVGKGEVDIESEADREAAKEKEKTYADVLECLKDKLEAHVKEVRLSTRLKSSPACLVGDVGDISPQLEQLLRANNQEVPVQKRILELNPDHPIMERLKSVFGDDRASPVLDDMAQVLYGQAIVAEGGKPPNPGKFAKLVSDLMVKSLG